MAIENEFPNEQIEDLNVTDREAPVGSANDVNVVVEGEEPVVEEQVEDDFNKNIAEEMDERDLQDLANQLISDFRNDKLTREDWEQSYTKGLDLLGFKYTLQTRPFQLLLLDYHHPLACLQYPRNADQLQHRSPLIDTT